MTAYKPLNPWKLSGYKVGQNVICKVTHPESGGYAVIIPKDNLPGFLTTSADLRVHEEILAEFVCVQDNRLMLCSRKRGPYHCSVQWNTTSAEPQNPWGYLPGRKLVCKVISSDPGGYSVLILERNLTGFIPSRANFKVDEVIVAQFNCLHDGRILLSAQLFDTPPPEDGPDQQGAPVPKNPLPIIGGDALSVPLPMPKQNENAELE